MPGHDARRAPRDPRLGRGARLLRLRRRPLGRPAGATVVPIRPGVVYPEGWRAFTLRIRERAGERCECDGRCGLHRTHPGPRRCEERNGEPARWAKGTVVLTVAHLNADGDPCRCDPLCAEEAHVLAMCQRCHLRYDAPLHARNGRATRREAKGVVEMFPPSPERAAAEAVEEQARDDLRTGRGE